MENSVSFRIAKCDTANAVWRRQGLGIEGLHLQLRIWQSNAKAKGQSLGVIYVDIKSAFYTAVKAMLASYNGTEDSLCSIFQRLGMPDSADQDFLNHVGQSQAIHQATGIFFFHMFWQRF